MYSGNTLMQWSTNSEQYIKLFLRSCRRNAVDYQTVPAVAKWEARKSISARTLGDTCLRLG
jgi:hypothetical protein